MAGNIIPAIATTNAIIAGSIAMRAIQLLSYVPPSTSTPTPNSNSTTTMPASTSAPTTNLGLTDMFLSSKTGFPLQAMALQAPIPSCSVCRDTYVSLGADPAQTTLGDVIRSVVRAERTSDGASGGLGWGNERKLSVYESGRLLLEPLYSDDEDEEGGMDNERKTLEELGVGVGMWLRVVDEEDDDPEGRWASVGVAVCNLSVVILSLLLPVLSRT